MHRTHEGALVHKILIPAVAAALLASPAMAAPSPAAILAANRAATGGDAWNHAGALKLSVALSGMGLNGKATETYDLSNGHYAESYNLGPLTGGEGFDGKAAWSEDSSGTVKEENGGDARQLAINNAYRNANLWWQPGFGGAKVTNEGEKTVNGTPCEVLGVTPQGGKPFEAFFDTKSHLLVRLIEKQTFTTVRTDYSDYRRVSGIELPGMTVVDQGQGAKYLQTQALTDASLLPGQPDSAYGPPKVDLHDYDIAGGKHETTVSFELLNNHVYGHVNIDGHGPLLFIFDTGGHDILTRPTVKAVGVKIEGALPGSGAGTNVEDYGLTHVKALKIGDATLHHQLFGVLDFQPEGVAGFEEQGMVGYEIFKRFVTRIDYSGRTVTLIDTDHFDRKDAGTPVHFVFNGDIPEVTGTFEGIPADFDIDTGARDELTLTAPFAEKHDLRASHPKGVIAVDGWGVGGPTRGYNFRGKSITLGPVTLDNVTTSLSIQKKGSFSSAAYSGNVGTRLLKRFIVTFDYGHQIMYLKPEPGPVADSGVFDRSGMWINVKGDGFDVMDVTPGGPAEKAGIKAGDVIASVNGKPASSIRLTDMRTALRDEAPGTVMHFEVERAGQQKAIDVTMRDQI
jgi:hypothetical protein